MGNWLEFCICSPCILLQLAPMNKDGNDSNLILSTCQKEQPGWIQCDSIDVDGLTNPSYSRHV